ncbi:MAG: UDP-3-O-(3-hydroxymyristoyl)glucosamine N-acyltransferase [Gammaproteobacteria bacterium]|nr:UDP-3-O-(3-hydroxymyristoyl)glucosamine N-acyltransferase [Gammaproteobacteria bacterium]
MPFTLGELAVRFGLALRGDPDRIIDHIGTIAGAGPRGLAFFANPKLVDQLTAANAGAIVLHSKMQEATTLDCLLADNPHASFAHIAQLLHPVPMAPAGVHPAAVVAADADIHPSAHVGPLVVIGARSRIGARAFIGAGSVIGDDVSLGDDVRLVARVTVMDKVVIGERSILHPGAVIGADGFGYAAEGERWVFVPQVGTVRIGCDVEIGANTAIDRGALEDTVIGNGVKMDNLVQIGHNCRVGDHTALAGCAGMAGSAEVGARCRIGGGVCIAGHLTICDDVTLTGTSFVTHDIREPGIYAGGGIPVESASEWRRIVGRVKRLGTLAQRVTDLERGAGSANDSAGTTDKDD